MRSSSFRPLLGLVASVGLVSCGGPTQRDDARLLGDVDPVGELGTFQLQSTKLPAALSQLKVVNASYFIAGLRVVPDGAAVKVKPGQHCLVARFPTVTGRADAELSDCSVAIEKARQTSYTLAAFVPKVSNAEADFGLKPWFRAEQVALDVSGGSLYRVPAIASSIRVELVTVEGRPHAYRREGSTHVLSDLARPLNLRQGAVEAVDWALPERRRTVSLETLDTAKYALVQETRLLTSTRSPIASDFQSESLVAGTRASLRFFPDAALGSARMCSLSSFCVDAPVEFLKGLGLATNHTIRAEVFNFNAFETGVDGKVSINRVAASGNKADDTKILERRAPTFSALLFPGTYRFVFWRSDAAGVMAEVGESVVEAAR
jgi:hypothetical protein